VAVPGVCFLSQTAVLANAKVGLAATARLKQIADMADAELKTRRDPLDAEAKALQSMQSTLSAVDLQTRRQALADKTRALEQLTQTRRQEVELTRQKAVGQIDAVEQPILADVYAAHHCGILLDRSNVLGGNMAGDLTTDVAKGLDAKMTTITFERASLPAQAASAAGTKK
jgi:Skp family chaperone for outer membrane proteins